MTLRFLFLLLLAGLGGCVLYRPMPNAAPNIHAQGEGEVAASWFLNSRLAASGSYSPVRHVLVHAAGSFIPKSASKPTGTDSSGSWEHQYDVGLGTYWNLGPAVTAGALAGFGRGSSYSKFTVSGFFFLPVRYDYQMQFTKYFGEGYLLYQPSPNASLGAAFRVTQVTFTSLTNFTQPLNLTGMTRLESMVFLRAGLGGMADQPRPFQLQLALGFSATQGFNERTNTVRENYYVLEDRGYITLSIAAFPQRLRQSK